MIRSLTFTFLFSLSFLSLMVVAHYRFPATDSPTYRRLASLATTASSARLRNDPFLVHRILARTPPTLRTKFETKQKENRRILLEIGQNDVSSSSSTAQTDPVPTFDCETCEFIVAVAQTIAENTTLLNETITIIQEGCTALLDPTIESVCDSVVDGMLELLPFLDKQLNTLAWDIPLGFCSVFFPVCQINCCETPTTPEQLFLSLTNDPSVWSITWTTGNATDTSTVQYGPATNMCNNLPLSNNGDTRTYTASSWIGTIHTAFIPNLEPGNTYTYRVGDSNGGYSDCYNFTTFPRNIGTAQLPLVIAQIGDMDYNANDTIASIANLGTKVHLVMHVGDGSYADGYDIHFDEFQERVSVIYRTVPVIYCRGNHELWYNFTAYKARLGDSMPLAVDPVSGQATANNGSYFSVNIGNNVHITMFNTETADDTADVDPVQLQWLQTDLSTARANPNITWSIAAGHRPLYCTNDQGKNTDCNVFASILRGQTEALFNSTRTDLVIAAHMHGYEKFWPVYNSKLIGTNYSSPRVPIYLVNGAASNREGNEKPDGNYPFSPPNSQFGDIGYGLMTIVSNPQGPVGSSSLNYQFIRSSDQTVLDDFTITK